MTKNYDLAFLKDYFNDDTSSIATILKMYLNETPKELLAIEYSILSKDIAAAKAATHKIKANVAMLGLHDSTSFIDNMHLLQPSDSVPEDVRFQFLVFKQEVLSALEEIKADFFEAPLS